MKLKIILVAIFLSVCSLNASVADYQEIYNQEHEEFNQKMREEIKKSVTSYSQKVQELYNAIDHRPVWVDNDYLTHHAELLIHELKADFKKGLHKELVPIYNTLIPNEATIFVSDSLKERVKIELGLMELYVSHIDAILEGRKSEYTALSLLQHALKEEDLLHALNAISKERIKHRTPLLDQNMTILKESETIDKDSTILLTGDSKTERLKALYELLHFQPVWITQAGFSSYSKDLFKQIEDDITLDRNGSIYQKYQKIKLLIVPKDKQKIHEYEFQIAGLFDDYISHLLYGNIDWNVFQEKLKHKRNANWVVHNVLSSPESLLLEAIIGQGSLNYAFKEATPHFYMYGKLLKGLEKYQEIVKAGGWEELPDFTDLKPGMNDPIVPELRERLAKEGDYVPCKESNNSDLYDECLVEAVKKFQNRHGLANEGYIGKMTRKALKESAEEKVARIKLNLDRMKWIKRSDDRYQIWVNIPAYTMYMYDKDQLIESMKVIVGRNGHNTPVFYNRVRSVVLNPYWRIPASIIRAEIIPKLKRNRNYTDSKNIEIHTGYSEHSSRVNPHTVNWNKYGRKLPPFRFMQSPGTDNALGKIKYLFPNKYSVYMHDTNQRNLFSKDVRSLSHGCVRLHKPIELLETFSKIEPDINFEKAKAVLEENKKTPIRLSNTVPVDLIYITTWVENDGTVAFRDDIYGYDKLQLSTMK